MKKTIVFLTIAALIISASGILAQTALAQVDKPVRQDKNKPSLSPAERLLERLTAAVERTKRLLELADRLIAKFESKGVGMTEPKTLRAAAVTAIENAEKAIEKYKTEINQTKTVITTVRKAGAEAIKAVKEAHAQVVKVISAIRVGYNRAAEKTATTTP